MKNELIEIGKEHADFYRRGEESYKTFLNNSISALDTMVSVYGELVRQDKILKIEDLVPETKTELWTWTKEWCRVDRSTANLIKFSKTIWAINNLLQHV